MSQRYLKMQDVLATGRWEDTPGSIYALESFAREVDYHAQTKLLTTLILDHATIARRVEQLNQELAQSRERLAEAQEIALLGRWDIDPGTGSVIWSQSTYDILEIDSSVTASSELFLSSVHPDDLTDVRVMFQQMVTSHKPWTTRYRLLMKDGRIKWVHVRFHSKFDDQGNFHHFYGTIQDVTELKKFEDELERYSQHLEQMVEEKVQEISESQMATIYALIKLSESRDDDTGAHIERTASFCRLLAQKLQSRPEYAAEVTDAFIETIYKAAPLHDIGKVGIPDGILLKPGKLTPDEWSIMKTHVQIGYETLSQVSEQYKQNEFLKMGIDIALYHHEKWDGSGYLQGLQGEAIPLAARIMALSDVYDALRSKRVYKDAFSHAESIEIIRSSQGSHFDPLLVDTFLQNQKEFESLYESITSLNTND